MHPERPLPSPPRPRTRAASRALSRAFAAALAAALAIAVGGGALGCATTKIDPRFSRAERFALVSVFAYRSVFVRADDLSALGASDVGQAAIEILAPETERRLAELIDPQLVPPARVRESPAFEQLTEASDAESFTRVDEMLALDLDPRFDPQLGALAAQLGVDVVIAIRHEWSVEPDDQPGLWQARDPRGARAFDPRRAPFSAPLGDARGPFVIADRATAIAVDKDGARLVELVHTAEARAISGRAFTSLGAGGGLDPIEMRGLAARTGLAIVEELGRAFRAKE